jgi:dihydroxy-acid dehydratase
MPIFGNFIVLYTEEIQQRLVGWKRPKPKFTKGWLGVYSKLASSAAQGAIIKCEE